MFPFIGQAFDDPIVEVTHQWTSAADNGLLYGINNDTYIVMQTHLLATGNRNNIPTTNPAWEATLNPYGGVYESDSENDLFHGSPAFTDGIPSMVVTNPYGPITYDWVHVGIEDNDGDPYFRPETMYPIEIYKNNNLDALDDTSDVPFFRDVNFQYFAAFTRQFRPGGRVGGFDVPALGKHERFEVTITDTGSAKTVVLDNIRVLHWSGV